MAAIKAENVLESKQNSHLEELSRRIEQFVKKSRETGVDPLLSVDTGESFTQRTGEAQAVMVYRESEECFIENTCLPSAQDLPSLGSQTCQYLKKMSLYLCLSSIQKLSTYKLNNPWVMHQEERLSSSVTISNHLLLSERYYLRHQTVTWTFNGFLLFYLVDLEKESKERKVYDSSCSTANTDIRIGKDIFGKAVRCVSGLGSPPIRTSFVSPTFSSGLTTTLPGYTTVEPDCCTTFYIWTNKYHVWVTSVVTEFFSARKRAKQGDWSTAEPNGFV